MGLVLLFLIHGFEVYAEGRVHYRCVGSFGARAPTLLPVDAAESDLRTPILVGDRYEIQAALTESEVMALLLDSTEVFVSNSKKADLITKQKTDMLDSFCKRYIPKRELEKWMVERPEWFVDVTPGSSSKAEKVGALLRLRDLKQRYLKFSGRVLVPGWIDGAEVRSAEIQGRTYLRINHPVTHRLRSVLVLDRNGIPVGALSPAREPTDLDWSDLWRFSKTPTAKKRRLEAYTHLMEEAAYVALLDFPDRVDSIRRVQEFYKNLLKAYELYPDSKQFLTYKDEREEKRGLASQRGVIEAEFDERFFDAIRSTRIQESYAQFSAFDPDSSLYRIYLEFRSRLQF